MRVIHIIHRFLHRHEPEKLWIIRGNAVGKRKSSTVYKKLWMIFGLQNNLFSGEKQFCGKYPVAVILTVITGIHLQGVVFRELHIQV